MSEQMDRDWIEQEYDKWAKEKICDPCGQAERCQYVATLFAEYILKRSASFHGSNNLNSRSSNSEVNKNG